MWQSVGALGAKPVVARWLKRSGYRTVLLLSVAGSALLTTAPGFYRAATPVWCMIATFVISGFVRSNQFTATNTMAYADVPANKVSAASTLATVTQQVGLSLGISFGGAVLHLARGNGALTPDRFTVPYLAIGAVTLLAWPVFWRLPADAGSSIGGRRRRSAVRSVVLGDREPEPSRSLSSVWSRLRRRSRRSASLASAQRRARRRWK